MALNGRFPDSDLAYLGWFEADHLRLIPAAATSITRLAAAFEAEFSKPLYLSDAYRTYAQQVYLKKIKGTFAATPGKSNHGLGLAIDMASRINIDGSDEHRWMEANGPSFGWINPYWAEDYNPGNGEHEPWHWEYHHNLNTYPTPIQEDDMFSDTDRITLASAAKDASDAEANAFNALKIVTRLEKALGAASSGVVGTIDYAALAKAVNDDAARRLAS